MSGTCEFFEIGKDTDFDAALQWVRARCESNVPLGVGYDVATTEKQTSNPSAVSLVEQHGQQYVVRAILVWKTKDPAVVRERFRRLLPAISVRGMSARRLCIDATSERLFATDLARDLADLVPVELVISSTSVRVPGREEPTNLKTLLGDQLIAALNDNRLTLPPARYVREDWRLLRKERGLYTCAVDEQGRHGDTFDSTKLGRRALDDVGGYSAELV
jgi:hypothetical protein